MGEIACEHLYERLEGAPYVARVFFESVIEHFQSDNMVAPHHTDTNGGDLRLAIPGAVLGQKRLRNFTTMYWQTREQIVFSRTFLKPDELKVMGFGSADKSASDAKPLRSYIRLGEEIWRYGVHDFIRALEMAKIKLFEATQLSGYNREAFVQLNSLLKICRILRKNFRIF